ncbi:MAG TPA: glycosyltransferase family 87 protein [Pirellulales bacterium]
MASQGRLASIEHSQAASEAAGGIAISAALWRTWRWCRRHAHLFGAVLFFVGMCVPFVRKVEQGEWQRCFVRAAQRMERGEIIHRPHEPNTYAYPPAMAMFVMPLAQLPLYWSLFAWYIVNVAAMMTAISCAWRLIGATSLAELDRSWWAVFWLGLFLVSRFLVAPLENQQFDVVITACVFAGCLAQWRGREVAAAFWLGIAAAMKCTPLLFAPYLVWRGRIRAAALMALIAVFVNRLPDYFWPLPNGASYLGDWIGTCLLKLGQSTPGVWDSDVLLNQSLSGLVNRLAQSGIPLSTAQLPSVWTMFSSTATSAIRWLTYGSGLGLLAITALSFGRPGRAAAVPALTGGAPAPWASLKTPLELAAVLCLMLLLSPMSSKAHYVILLLPCLFVSRAAIEKRLDWRLWLPPLILLGPLTAKGITGKPLGDLMLAWGFPTLFAAVLLAALWTLNRRREVT